VSGASSAANLVALATTGLTTGDAARAFTVGSAGVVYNPNPRVIASFEHTGPGLDAMPGRSMDAEVMDGVDTRAPQGLDEFVRMYASSDGKGGISYFLSADTFEALQHAWDADALNSDKLRMVHSFWMYSSFMALSARTKESLGRFEGVNPGRGDGTALNKLAKATHTAWLEGEKREGYYTPYTQEVHGALSKWIEAGLVTSVSKETHIDPRKKFKLEADGFNLPEEARATLAFARHFRQVTGRTFESGFRINTVGGEWDVLSSIQEPRNPDWEAQRVEYLFKLQTDNVAAVLYGLENQDILNSLSEGSTADITQSMIEMLRIINVAWRVNNPWGGINSPLIGKPFALEGDGGIGIRDIVRDAVTLRAALEVLEAGRIKRELTVPDFMAAGLGAAFSNDAFLRALDVVVEQDALEAAVRFNTDMYGLRNPLEV